MFVNVYFIPKSRCRYMVVNVRVVSIYFTGPLVEFNFCIFSRFLTSITVPKEKKLRLDEIEDNNV